MRSDGCLLASVRVHNRIVLFVVFHTHTHTYSAASMHGMVPLLRASRLIDLPMSSGERKCGHGSDLKLKVGGSDVALSGSRYPDTAPVYFAIRRVLDACGSMRADDQVSETHVPLLWLSCFATPRKMG